MAVLDVLPEVSPARYRRITQWALWSLVFIVVTGAAVRLTESGLGCSTWPGCEPGQFVPHDESSLNPWIEFANRLVTGLVSVAVAVAVLGSLRRVPRRRDLTLLAWGLVAGVVGQILLGALVVKLEVHPIVVQGHFLLSVILVADAVVLHHRAQLPDGADGGPDPVEPLVDRSLRRLAGVAVALAVVVMLVGTVVTGSGPHSGDAAADRLDFSVRAVAMVHSASTWLFLAVVITLGVRLRRAGAPAVALDRATTLLVAVVLQGALGYLQYFTGVPELLVGLHVFGSMLVWAAVLRLLLTLAEPVPPPGSAPLGSARPATAASR